MIRVSSIFGQMLQLFSRAEFERAFVEHRAERHARGFTCWGQFVAMLFCHPGAGPMPWVRAALARANACSVGLGPDLVRDDTSLHMRASSRFSS